MSVTLKSQFFDARLDLRGCLRHHRIDQDVALRRRYQIGRQAIGSDIIDIADHLERLGWRVPLYSEGREQILGSLSLRCTDKRN
jgi:hypothetical protein